MIRTPSIYLLTLTLAFAPALRAQPTATKPDPALAAKAAQDLSKTCTDCAARRHDDGTWPTRTFYLKYATSQNDINEIATAIRQLLPPPDQTFVIASEDAIVMHAPPDDLVVVQKLLDDLDIPKKSWRLTYTVSEMDGDKRVGTQHYSVDVVANQESTLKQGDRVPIATGAFSTQTQANQTQIAYQDVGMTFDAQLVPQAGAASLKASIERSSAAASALSPADPVFRQSAIKGTFLLTPNKPLILGTMDIPESTHHLQIEVLMEPLP